MQVINCCRVIFGLGTVEDLKQSKSDAEKKEKERVLLLYKEPVECISSPAPWTESIGLSLVTFWLAETAWVIISNPALSATAALLCVPKSHNFSSICASHTHFSVFQNQMTFLPSAFHIRTSPCFKIRWLFFHLRFTYLCVPKSDDFSSICASHTHFSVFQNQMTFLPSALHISPCSKIRWLFFYLRFTYALLRVPKSDDFSSICASHISVFQNQTTFLLSALHIRTSPCSKIRQLFFHLHFTYFRVPKSDDFSSICASHTHFSVFQNQITFLPSALHIRTSRCSKIRWLFFHLRFTYLRVPKSDDFSSICASHTHFSVFQNQITFLPSVLHISPYFKIRQLFFCLRFTYTLLHVPKSEDFSSICTSHISVFQNQMTFLPSALHIRTSPCSKIRWLFFHLHFTYALLHVSKSDDFSSICASHTHFSMFQNQSTFLPSALHIHMCGWPSVFTLLWLFSMVATLHFTWEKALLVGLWFLGIKIRGRTLNRELLLHPEVMAL